MSWLLTLKKQMKPWKESLPTNASQWENIIVAIALSKGQNTEFIDDIRSGDYSTKGINKTIGVLKDWKRKPRLYRKMSQLNDLVYKDKVLTDEEMKKIITDFTHEVLPRLETRVSDIQGGKGNPNPPKQTKEGDKTYQWNKPEDIIRYLEDKNFNKSTNKKTLLLFVNDNIPTHRLTASPKLHHWIVKNNVDKILNKLFNQNIFTKKSPIIRLSGIKLKSKIKQGEKTKRQPAKERSLKALLDEQITKYENWKVVEPFGSEQTKKFYKFIVPKNTKFKPTAQGFKHLDPEELKNPDLLNLLNSTYDNLTDEMLKTFIDNAETAVFKRDKDIENEIIRTLLDGDSFKLGTKPINLTPAERNSLSENRVQAEQELRKMLKTKTKGQETGIAIDYENALSYLKNLWTMKINNKEKGFIDSLEKKYEDLWEELEEYKLDTMADSLEAFHKKIKGIEVYREKDGKYFFISGSVKDAFTDLKEEVATNREELKKQEMDEFNGLLEEITIVESPDSQIEISEYTMTGFNKLEKTFAKLVYDALKSGEDLDDVIENANINHVFDIGDILKVFKHIGGAMSHILSSNYVTLINAFTAEEDINFNAEKPYMFDQIKKMVEGLKTDIPKLRDYLIISAKEHIEKILEHPSLYIQEELRLTAKESGKKHWVGPRGDTVRVKNISGKEKGKTHVVHKDSVDENKHEVLEIFGIKEGQTPIGDWEFRATRGYKTSLDLMRTKELIKE